MNSFVRNVCHLQRSRNTLSVADSIFHRRWLSLHEYLSFQILRDNGLTIPRAEVANTAEEAKSIASKFANDHSVEEFVIKAQVLAGGRGKGSFVPSKLKGGVKMAFSPDEVESLASKMLNNTLITKQTGAKGMSMTNGRFLKVVLSQFFSDRK